MLHVCNRMLRCAVHGVCVCVCWGVWGEQQLDANGTLLLYLAADGAMQGRTPADKTAHKKSDHSAAVGAGQSLYRGGLVFQEPSSHHSDTKPSRKTKPTQSDVIHPGDIMQFTRNPLFLVVDGPGSCHFTHMESRFGQHCVVLLSPTSYPDDIVEPKMGSLFSYFLHAPLEAICYLCASYVRLPGVPNTKAEERISVKEMMWNEASTLFASLVATIRALLHTVWDANQVPDAYKAFAQDPFLNRILVRFIIFYYVCLMHPQFDPDTPSHYPQVIGHFALFVCACVSKLL